MNYEWLFENLERVGLNHRKVGLLKSNNSSATPGINDSVNNLKNIAKSVTTSVVSFKKISHGWLGENHVKLQNESIFKKPHDPTIIVTHFYSHAYESNPANLKVLIAQSGRECQIHDFLYRRFPNKDACFDDLRVLSEKHIAAKKLLDPYMRKDMHNFLFGRMDSRAASYKIQDNKVTSLIELWRVRNVSGGTFELTVTRVVVY